MTLLLISAMCWSASAFQMVKLAAVATPNGDYCSVQIRKDGLGWILCSERLWQTEDHGLSWLPRALPIALEFAQYGVPLRGRLYPEAGGWVAIRSTVFEMASNGEWKQVYRIPMESSEQVFSIDISDDGRRVLALVEDLRQQFRFIRSIDQGLRWDQGEIRDATRAAWIQDRAFLFGVHRFWSAVGYEMFRLSRLSGLSVGPHKSLRDDGQRVASVAAFGKRIWVAYPDGSLLRSDDLGAKWKELSRANQIWGSRKRLRSVTLQATSESVVVLVGDDGIMRESQNGGLTWIQSCVDCALIDTFHCETRDLCHALSQEGVLYRVKRTSRK